MVRITETWRAATQREFVLGRHKKQPTMEPGPNSNQAPRSTIAHRVVRYGVWMVG